MDSSREASYRHRRDVGEKRDASSDGHGHNHGHNSLNPTKKPSESWGVGACMFSAGWGCNSSPDAEQTGLRGSC